MSRPTLRPYQVEALRQIDAAVAAGQRRPLLVLPTGAGKTCVAAALIEAEVARGGRVLFTAPRRELIHQTCHKLDDVAVPYGVLLAGDAREDLAAPVQVASIDTLHARMGRRGALTVAGAGSVHAGVRELPPFSLVVVDECHLSITLARQTLLTQWPAAVRLGLTATPGRKDGRALGVLYDALLQPTTVAGLTAAGYLVPARYFSWPTPDLSGIRVAAGDYHQGALDAAMNTAPLVGDIVEHWLRHAGARRTVVFATSIAHAVGLAAAFRRAGVAAEHVDAGTPADERAATFARFRRGETQVLTNCFLAAYGFDLPALSCIVLARPTQSLVLYLQMLGRGLRPAPDKTDCLVLDHAGCVHAHGFADDPRSWTLDGRMALTPPAATAPPARPQHVCPDCHAVFRGLRVCPACGFELQARGALAETLPGDLVAIGATPSWLADTQARRQWYQELRGYAAEQGYQPGWAAHKYRRRHGVFPPWAWTQMAACFPSDATRRWIRSEQIRWARRRDRDRRPA